MRSSGRRGAVFVDSDGASQTLSVLARGDWNGDGIEDLMLKREISLEGGSYSAVGLALITRAVNADRYTLLALFPHRQGE
jgi:hypothetical protein